MSYEAIFIDDGSRDRSAALLKDQFLKRPDETRVILFNANYGQHMAIVAGFEHCRGERIVTLDADLQNPPEEIGKLVAAMDAGHDYVGGIRRTREDTWWRHMASRAMNRVRERITRIKMTDQGCMLRAYSRDISRAIAASREVSTFIPALAYTFSHNPTEVEVAHAERAAGESKYSLYKLITAQLRPDHRFLAGAVAVVLDVRDARVGRCDCHVSHRHREQARSGRKARGLGDAWVRDILMFFLLGMALFGLGPVGEYVGRIYQQVRDRPRYTIQVVLETRADERNELQRTDDVFVGRRVAGRGRSRRLPPRSPRARESGRARAREGAA